MSATRPKWRPFANRWLSAVVSAGSPDARSSTKICDPFQVVRSIVAVRAVLQNS
ncbi:hypothetical protein [Gaopeijia maritima]|uniref:Uncharacterized protein n=1 Tax=Gaopeijia maritima TaxID=3119007 RepID=A0ABU9EFA8_9BACT